MEERERRRQLMTRGIWLFLWMSLIFFLSGQTGSGAVWTPPLWYILERKSAHILEYGVLMLFAFRFFWLFFRTELLPRILLLSGIFSLVYGATDELHQFFVYGRGAHFSDVAVDGIGILLACIVLLALRRRSLSHLLAKRRDTLC